MFKKFKGTKLSLVGLSLVVALAGCNTAPKDEAKKAETEEAKQVVILTNGDEAVTAMENALNGAGYEGEYVFQSLGTSELGGKLMAEGDQIDANLVTMSSYFVESAQEKHNMFKDLTFKTNALEQYPSY